MAHFQKEQSYDGHLADKPNRGKNNTNEVIKIWMNVECIWIGELWIVHPIPPRLAKGATNELYYSAPATDCVEFLPSTVEN